MMAQRHCKIMTPTWQNGMQKSIRIVGKALILLKMLVLSVRMSRGKLHTCVLFVKDTKGG